MEATSRLRRLSDVLRHLDFLEVQLVAIQRESGPHHIRMVGERIARIHRSMDELEHELRRRAADLGESADLPLRTLRRRLAARKERRQGDVLRPVVERRRRARRRSDVPAGDVICEDVCVPLAALGS